MQFRNPPFQASVDMNTEPFAGSNQDDSSCFEELIEQARKGDAESVGELVRRWRKYLLLIANENLEQDLQAKIAPSDIVQQSLIDVQQHIADFRGSSEAEFQSWVRSILKNNVHAARRKYKSSQQRDLKREVAIDDPAGHMGPLADRGETPRTAALRTERRRILASAMDQLPDHYQQVIQLRNHDEMTFVQIAESIGGTEDTARKLWSRAILRLQKVIDDDHPGFQSNTTDGST